MAGRMDRYVAATVAGAYLAALVFLAMMFVVFDLLFEMDSYVSVANRDEIGVFELATRLATFHLYNMPLVFVTIGPFVTVIACMFALSRLMASNEIGPMIFTGRSMIRVLMPMLSISVFSALAMGATWQWLIPAIAEDKESIYANLTGREHELKRVTLRSKEHGRRELFCRVYRHREQSMEGVILYDRGTSRADGVFIEAALAQWNQDENDWDLVDGRRVTGGIDNDKMTRQKQLGMKGLTPSQILDSGKTERETAELSYSELRQLMRLQPGKADYILAFHVHFTFPLANIILILLALPFAVSFERGRRIERVVFSIAICAGYLILDLTCQNLAYKGIIHPVVAAWTPTIIFGSLGAVVFGSMRS